MELVNRISKVNNSAVAGRAILPTITTALTRIANSSDPLKLYIEQISYKPFLSLFNMTAVTEENPQLAAIGERYKT